MSRAIIQDWTESNVLLKYDQQHEVRYRVYREDDRHYLDIENRDTTKIHVLELPEALKLDTASYEVLLRYVLLDVVAA